MNLTRLKEIISEIEELSSISPDDIQVLTDGEHVGTMLLIKTPHTRGEEFGFSGELPGKAVVLLDRDPKLISLLSREAEESIDTAWVDVDDPSEIATYAVTI